MLQLLARKEQPRAEQQIGEIGLEQREGQVVDLIRKGYKVPGFVERIPRVEGFDGQPGNLFGERTVGHRIVDEFNTFAEEGNRSPRSDCEQCKSDDEHQEFPHFGQSQRPIPSIGFRKQRMRIRLIPNVECHVEIARSQREEGEFNQRVRKEQRGHCICGQLISLVHVLDHVNDDEDVLQGAQRKMRNCVDFPQQNWAAGEFEQKVSAALHPTDIWQ